MAEAIHNTFEGGVLALAHAHAAAIFLTDTADGDEGEAVFYAARSLWDEAHARAVTGREDAIGKLVLLKTLLSVANGGEPLTETNDESELIDQVVRYLRADA